jgi:hypothetical protein
MEAPMDRTVAPQTWYVYTYAYPNGSVFYVGKGCHARIEDHEREAQRGCECEKCRTIRQIWQSGQPVQKRIVYETLDEQEAFKQEQRLIIDVFGLENLTNRSGGISRPPRRSSSIVSPTKVGIDENYQETGFKPNLKDLRIKAGLSASDLARLAKVKDYVIGYMEGGRKPVTRVMAYKVLNVLSSKTRAEV